ncbi:MAG: uracil-DNA glycosylase family protein [Candidatus Dojkabacteria bacterium]
MQLTTLIPKFDKLQLKHGDGAYSAIYGAGQTNNPDICFVYMNPTARNVSASKDWKGIRAAWLGTKHVWKLYAKLGLLSPSTLNKIQELSPAQWNPDFASKLYTEVSSNNYYITNLAKCTQADARPLRNTVFRDYLQLMHHEIESINPKTIITFGNQVSSILLGRPISVSKTRKKAFPLTIKAKEYQVYPVYYPVGQGMRNMPRAVEDIRWIMRGVSYTSHPSPKKNP